MEMYRAFLRAELDSPTEGDRLGRALSSMGLDEKTVLGDSADIRTLSALFKEYRGHEFVFDGLDLDHMEWYWFDLEWSDLQGKTYTCRNTFEERYGTRNVTEVARVWDLQNRPNGVMARLQDGAPLEVPIVVAGEDLQRFVILEGHNRLISFARSRSSVCFPVTVIVGINPEPDKWSQW